MSQPGQKMHNAKAVAGKAKKAEAEGKKDAKKQEEHEKSQAADWYAKASSTADKEAERARKEAERRALLEEEDASTDAAAAKAKKPSASKKKSKDDQNAMLLAGLDAGKKKPAKVQEPTPAKVAAPPAAVKKPSGLAEPMRLEENMNRMQVDEESASGINQALDMLGAKKPVVNESGNFNRKALYAAYKETALVSLKESHPGLKKSQYDERIFASWQKSPENPENLPK